ncbi:MAG: sulfotransferase family protein [Deltaproteobacteria bacterium]|nr:sulfotransferase family protein [Deltaproteobacteria bacterium]
MRENTANIQRLTDFSKKRSTWVRALNALCGPFESLVRLDHAGLLEAARRKTGLEDFGEDEFRAPLEWFTKALEQEAQLTFLGRVLARRDVLVLLCNRLQIVETLRRHPEIEDQPVEQPLFIVGLSRSGTSILHELLTQDPNHRSLLSWEARYPCPPPRSSTYNTDRRIRLADFELTLWPKIVPAYQAMHEMGGRIPTECGDITCHAFLGDRLTALHQVPSYAARIVDADMRPAYEMHKRILQILQWRTGNRRWLLKAPAHMNWLPTLFDVYPDARVIQTHRDPLQIMGSTVSLISAILWMRAKELDPEGVKLAFGPAYYAPQLYEVMRLRDEGQLPAAQFHDVRFKDLMETPFETIRTAYTAFGWEYTDDAERRMRSYLEKKPRGKFGKHFYSFHDLGLDFETERNRYRAYQERFGVASEVTA